MNRSKYIILLAVFVVIGASVIFFSMNIIGKYQENKWTRLIDECVKVSGEARKVSDQNLNGPVANCQAIGVFPSTISAGLGIGGEYGQGIIMVRHGRSWSPPAIFTLAGGSIGWQIGGQASDIILLFMDSRSVDAILSGKLKLGADASVAAGPVGRNASASTDLQFRGGILSYSMSRGLFVGAKLEGAVLLQQEEANNELYGKNLSAREILIENKARMPRAAYSFLKILEPDGPLTRFLKKIGLIK